MKCMMILMETLQAVEHPLLQGFVQERDGQMVVTRRCNTDAVEGSDLCASHRGSEAPKSDMPARVILKFYVPKNVYEDFSGLETEGPDLRPQEERQVPNDPALRTSTKLVDHDLVDISGLIREMERRGGYIFKLRVGSTERPGKSTLYFVDVRLAWPGFYKGPAMLSAQAREALAEQTDYAAKVRVYRNTGYYHADGSNRSCHSLEVPWVSMKEDPRHTLQFAGGLWHLTPKAPQFRDRGSEPATATLEEHLDAAALAQQVQK